MISVEIYNHSKLSINHTATEELINNVIKDYEVESGTINLVIIDDESLRKMKYEYFNQDYYTDVIAFNIENSPFEGEIYISSDRVEDNALQYKQTTEEEMQRVIIHGTLHLCGEEDQSEAQKTRMESLEKFYLNKSSLSIINLP